MRLRPKLLRKASNMANCYCGRKTMKWSSGSRRFFVGVRACREHSQEHKLGWTYGRILRGRLLGGILYLKFAFCLGHPKGGQPVPHPGFEKQRCPTIVRRYLGGPGPPSSADLGGPGGPGRNKKYILLKASKSQPRKLGWTYDRF